MAIGRRLFRRMVASVGIAIPALLGCAHSEPPHVTPSSSAVALSGGPNESMVYLARTTAGIIAIDLGWWGSTDALVRQLRALDAAPGEVTDVFLTHTHRDHVGAWRLVRGATFHLSESELPRLYGDTGHRGVIPRVAERINDSDLPRHGELRVVTFSRDTAFTIGGDTLRAFLVPGHTAGSVAYLFRGTLFVGDAATFSRWSGFGPARRGFSDDAELAAVSLERLWARLPSGAVRQVCTAHAHCHAYSPTFVTDVSRAPASP